MEFEKIYNELNVRELEIQMQKIVPQLDISIFEMIKEVYEGNGNGILITVWENIKKCLQSEVGEIRNVLINIITIILLSALLSAFKDTFQNAQIAEISFYINYLLLMIIFINMFSNVLEIGEETLRSIEEFMRIFFPTFYLIVGSTWGIGTGLAYYYIAGGVIYLVEWCLISILLPAVSTYMLFVLMNGIWEEEKLTLLLELFQKGIGFFLKVLLGTVAGVGMIQSMIIPVMDRMRGENIYKVVETIPGVGEITEGVLRMWLGSAVLIKNSVGIIGCLCLLYVCLVPIIKIFILGGLLKATAAILSVVGEKKMINCTNQVGNGIFIVLQLVGYGVLFFIVLVAMTIYSTTGGI